MEGRDLRPLEFETIESDGRVLRADPPLRFEPNLDEESRQFYIAEDESLDLHTFATTREDLRNEIAWHILFAWDTYVGEKPDRLTQAARRLQQTYSSRFRLVPHA
jgi:hypothetical protein